MKRWKSGVVNVRLKRSYGVRRVPESPGVPEFTHSPVTGVGVVDTSEPLDSFDFSTADRWELLVLDRGEPSARIAFPSPGPIDSAELARQLIHPHTQARRRRRELGELLLRGLDVPATAPAPARECSVVLCTHGRPAHLTAALDALAALDPPPLEVIVVDNAPGSRDCREEVSRRGFVYLPEDRRGLDNARNAGIRAARGDVVVFTDDDCVHPAGWLQHLAEGFGDPAVAAVTGPVFPYRLDTPARVRMERQASLARGLRPRLFDWTLTSAMHAGQVGVGANMAIRASLLKAAPEPFPPELDAGTETRSGGDTYVFARLLAAGHRISYDPRAYIFHQHRADWVALERAVRGYGAGASAALWKLMVEDHELEAPRGMSWLLSQYLRTQARRVQGRADAVETRIAWAYLHGALLGPFAWRRSLSTQRAFDPKLRRSPPFPPPTATPARRRLRPDAPLPAPAGRGGEGAPAVTVIVPTIAREALTRCLAALEAQTLPASAFEVVVADDSPGGDLSLPRSGSVEVRLHSTGGRGAAVARNEAAELARGDLLLFLDDDLTAGPDLLAQHLARHAHEAHLGSRAPRVVIGYSAPAPRRPGLAALGAALWWEDRFRCMERAPVLSFTDALSGNVSIARNEFREGRRFDSGFARLRREDWEWGFRLLEGGAQLVYEPRAVAAHEYELGAGQRLRACRLEGAGDARLLERHPGAGPFLPLAEQRPRGRPRRLLLVCLGSPRADRLVLPVLAVLERARLRSAWSRLYRRAQRAAYAHGLCSAGWRHRPLAAPPVVDVELGSEGAVPRRWGAVPPRIRVTRQGRTLAELGAVRDWSAEALERLVPHPPGPHGNGGPPLSSAIGRAAGRVAVLLGPGRGPCDARAREQLAGAGALPVICDGEPGTHWPRLLEAARTTDAELLAVPLPGRAPEPVWLAEVAPAFLAPRVPLALGQGIPASRPAEPITLHDRGRGRVPYAPLGGPADYLIVRRSALPALERAATRAARYGPMAVVFACAEEVLAGGALVAHRNSHGLDPGDGRWQSARERERVKLEAWGALLAEQAGAGAPLRGAIWLAGLTAGGLSLGAVRRRRGIASSVSTMDTGRALVRGYAAAIRRVESTPLP